MRSRRKAQAIAYLLLHPQFLLTAIQLGILTVAQGAYSIAPGIAAAATTALGVAVDSCSARSGSSS
jgi:hypothetical protein